MALRNKLSVRIVRRCRRLCLWQNIHSDCQWDQQQLNDSAARHIKEHYIPLDNPHKTFATWWILPEILNFTPYMSTKCVTYLCSKELPFALATDFLFQPHHQHARTTNVKERVRRFISSLGPLYFHFALQSGATQRGLRTANTHQNIQTDNRQI